MIDIFINPSIVRSKSWLLVHQDKHILHPVPLLFVVSAEQGRVPVLQLQMCKMRKPEFARAVLAPAAKVWNQVKSCICCLAWEIAKHALRRS